MTELLLLMLEVVFIPDWEASIKKTSFTCCVLTISGAAAISPEPCKLGEQLHHVTHEAHFNLIWCDLIDLALRRTR